MTVAEITLGDHLHEPIVLAETHLVAAGQQVVAVPAPAAP
jgi:hypothetical protein